MSNPPAGWYPDPTGQPNTIRWWNGTQWTNRTEHEDLPDHPAAESNPAPAVGETSSAPTANEPADYTPPVEQHTPQANLDPGDRARATWNPQLVTPTSPDQWAPHNPQDPSQDHPNIQILKPQNPANQPDKNADQPQHPNAERDASGQPPDWATHQASQTWGVQKADANEAQRLWGVQQPPPRTASRSPARPPTTRLRPTRSRRARRPRKRQPLRDGAKPHRSPAAPQPTTRTPTRRFNNPQQPTRGPSRPVTTPKPTLTLAAAHSRQRANLRQAADRQPPTPSQQAPDQRQPATTPSSRTTTRGFVRPTPTAISRTPVHAGRRPVTTNRPAQARRATGPGLVQRSRPPRLRAHVRDRQPTGPRAVVRNRQPTIGSTRTLCHCHGLGTPRQSPTTRRVRTIRAPALTHRLTTYSNNWTTVIRRLPGRRVVKRPRAASSLRPTHHQQRNNHLIATISHT